MKNSAIVVHKPPEQQTESRTKLTVYIDTSKLDTAVTEATEELSDVESTELDDATLDIFSGRAREVAVERDRIERMRQAAVAPLNDEHARVQALFKPALAALDSLKRALASKIGAYQLAKDEERRALEAAAQRAAKARDQKALTQALEKAEAAGPVKTSGTPTRFAWRVASVDESKLPEAFFKRVVDREKIDALVKNLEGDSQPKKTPGITFERVALTSVRR